MTVDTGKFSKTTLFGVLSAALIIQQTVKFDVAGHLCFTARDWSQVIGALLLAAVGWAQKDAGKQEAVIKGKAGTTLVDAHETPDDPTATPVVKT